MGICRQLDIRHYETRNKKDWEKYVIHWTTLNSRLNFMRHFVLGQESVWERNALINHLA